MRFVLGAFALASVVLLGASDARACGGFFCSQSPVDQQAELILFSVDPGVGTTMIVQIGYAGGDADFTWVLPLGAVPDPSSLEVFPQLALTSLASNTGPIFYPPEDCWYWGVDADAGGAPPPSAPNEGSEVTVDLRMEVGPYDVAVVESESSAALVDWLTTNGYRITAPMEPYIQTYTEEGMKFLALKLLPDADVSQIAPLKLTLPGEAPMVPVRLTALAAEPEMGILVTILGDQRYEPANWPSLTINDAEISYDPWNVWGGNGTNWTSLVARKVDEAGGQGFVTEFAGSSAPFLDLVRNSPVNDETQEAAQQALLDVLEGHPYMTRLYTRLSAEEMRTDPMFRRSEAGDVAREHTLARIVDGVDMCPTTGEQPPVEPCDFTTCGAGGLCRQDETGATGCACVAQATARATIGSNGAAAVVCQDARMSFINPGDVDNISGGIIADPCLGASCGPNGRCLAVNLTTTCSCNQGFIAVADGQGGVTCVLPSDEVPSDFYQRTLPEPARPGRSLVTPPPPRAPSLFCACAQANGRAPLGALAVVALLALTPSLRRRLARAGVVLGVLAVPLVGGCALGGPEPTVEIGTGESSFQALTEGQDVPLILGVQGGYHVWMSLRATELDPDKVWLDVRTEVNGEQANSMAITELTDVDEHEGDACVLVGWPVIMADPQGVDGRELGLSVTVTDEDGMSADAAVTVRPHLPQLQG